MIKKMKCKLQVAGLIATAPVLSIVCGGITMGTSWESFQQSMKDFFETGLGGPGMAGIGIAIAAIGIVAAIGSFVIHKFNPQSRMPGWITCLAIAVVGSIAISGIKQPLAIINMIRDTVMGWIGV